MSVSKGNCRQINLCSWLRLLISRQNLKTTEFLKDEVNGRMSWLSNAFQNGNWYQFGQNVMFFGVNEMWYNWTKKNDNRDFSPSFEGKMVLFDAVFSALIPAMAPRHKLISGWGDSCEGQWESSSFWIQEQWTRNTSGIGTRAGFEVGYYWRRWTR